MKIIRTMLCALLILALAAAASGGAFALFAERPEEVSGEAAAVLGQARLLVNQGRGPEALALVREALSETGDPALEYGLVRLENRQWRQTRLTYFNRDGSVFSVHVHAFDEAGRLLETRDCDGKGAVVSVTVFEYGEDGFRCGSVTSDGSGNVLDRVSVVCNESGEPVRAEGAEVYEYEYDAFGDCTQAVCCRLGGNETTRTVYERDEYGSCTGLVSTFGGGTRDTSYDLVYESGEDGKTMTVRCYNAGTDVLTSVYEYEFVPFA